MVPSTDEREGPPGDGRAGREDAARDEQSPTVKDGVVGLAERLVAEAEKLSQEAKRKGEAEADGLIAAAQEEVRRIRERAQQVADKIINDAEGRAEQVTAKARAEVRQTIDDAIHRLNGVLPEDDVPVRASNGQADPAPLLESAEDAKPDQDKRAIPRLQYDLSAPPKSRSG